MEILTKKATSEPEPPQSLRAEIPETVDRLIMRAMGRDPAARPQSMEAFEYELTKCVAGRGVAVAKMLGLPVDGSLVRQDGTPIGASAGESVRVAMAMPAGTPPPVVV